MSETTEKPLFRVCLLQMTILMGLIKNLQLSGFEICISVYDYENQVLIYPQNLCN